jgi:uncharacterized protein YecT (DUF1311 family)
MLDVHFGAEADRQVPGQRMGEADIERAPNAISGFLWLGLKSRQAASATFLPFTACYITHQGGHREGMSMARTYALLSLLLASIASLTAGMGTARAQHMNADDAPCRSHQGTSGDAGFARCLSAAADTAGTDLNDAYRRVTSVLEAPSREELQEAQRSWLRYRDQTCTAERNLYEGGTGGLAAYSACLEALTRHRIADLKATYWWKVDKTGG